MDLIRLSALDWACFALLIIGAVNWGVIGVVDINVIRTVLDPVFRSSAAELLARVLYTLVGLAGLYFFYPLYRVAQQEEA